MKSRLPLNFSGRSAVSFLSFNLGWWACALGANYGYPWLGPALLPLWVGVHLALSPTPCGELLFFILLAGIGFVVDSAFIKLELFTVADTTAWAPLWLVSMWILMGLTYESILSWRRYTWLLLLSGAVTGPLTYVWCEAVELLTYARPVWLAVGVHGLIWGALTPLLFRVRDFSLIWALRAVKVAPRMAELEELPQPPAVELDWLEPADRHRDATPPTLH